MSTTQTLDNQSKTTTTTTPTTTEQQNNASSSTKSASSSLLKTTSPSFNSNTTNTNSNKKKKSSTNLLSRSSSQCASSSSHIDNKNKSLHNSGTKKQNRLSAAAQSAAATAVALARTLTNTGSSSSSSSQSHHSQSNSNSLSRSHSKSTTPPQLLQQQSEGGTTVQKKPLITSYYSPASLSTLYANANAQHVTVNSNSNNLTSSFLQQQQQNQQEGSSTIATSTANKNIMTAKASPPKNTITSQSSCSTTTTSTTNSNSITETTASLLNNLSLQDTELPISINNNSNNLKSNSSSTSLIIEQQQQKQNQIQKNMSISSKVEDLELISTVGTGTFGRVIAVRHKETKEYYALKIMSIMEIVRLKQVDHVKNEKSILTTAKHPFIIELFWTSHTDKFLYMLFEYVCGGELFSYLRNAVKFTNSASNFYAAEIVSALEYLHGLNIIYRDLKPENLLLDRDGHIKICDFGFAKKVDDRTWTLCGTPEYLAPEIIVGKGHHKAVDWWALGILIYEMLAGYPPFYDENPFQIYQKILACNVVWPRYIDLAAKDLIKKLLTNDRTKRLGSMKNGPEDIKRHKWFRAVDWSAITQRKLKPPILPKVTHEGDTRNFDKYEEESWMDVKAVPETCYVFEDF